MKQNSRSYFPVRTAPGFRMKIVAIIAAIAVIVFLAGCDCPPGEAPLPHVSILLLAETSQLIKVFPGTAPDAPHPHSWPQDILINTTYAGRTFQDFFRLLPPSCRRVKLDNVDILDQFDRIQNKGDAPIYSLIVPDPPDGNGFNAHTTYGQAFAEVREDFPNYERLKSAYFHRVGYWELFISDSTELIDPATTPRWENKKNFVDHFIEEICDGNAATCKYMTVIEPGTTGHIVNISFVRNLSLGR